MYSLLIQPYAKHTGN